MNDQDTRRLTVLLPVREVEQLRKLLLPDESMNDLLKRIVHERIITREGTQ
jgi:hypothetical protein